MREGGLSVTTEVRKPRGLSFLVRTRQICAQTLPLMGELVCLSSKWNILKASDAAVYEGVDMSGWQSGRNGFKYGATGLIRRQ